MFLGEILRAEPLHRADERRDVLRHLQRVAVRAPLVRARQRIGHGHQRQRHGAGREQQQRQRGDIPLPHQPERGGESRQHPIRQVEAKRNQHRLERDPLPDVAMHVMRELVREDDLDFIVRVFGQQRVRDDDAPRLPDARQRRVRFLRLVAEPPLEHAHHACAGAFGQRHQPLHQRLAIERLELVEERQQQHGRQLHEADHDQREDRRGEQPPSARIPANQRADDQRGEQRKHQRDAAGLQMIEPPARGGLR